MAERRAEPLPRQDALTAIKTLSAAEHAAFLAWQAALDDLRVACLVNSKHVLAGSHPDHLTYAEMTQAMEPPRDLTRPGVWSRQLLTNSDGVADRLRARGIEPIPAGAQAPAPRRRRQPVTPPK